nr:hypothetical protein [uncultured Flavobacterium sp.]
MILYYGIKGKHPLLESLKDNNPYLALGLLGLSVLLWVVLFINYIRNQILAPYTLKNNLEKIKTSGILREARILNAKKTSKSNSTLPAYELELSFKNLSNTEITEKIATVDSKPNERRFETGKNLNIVIDRDLTHPPYYTLANANPSINNQVITLKIVGLILLTVAVLFYYVYSYQTESYGMGWLFMSFFHPLIMCPIALLFNANLIKFMMRIIGLNNNTGTDVILLKFKGIKTTAKILSANQTGTYINRQPVVAFDIEYTDERNQVHQNTTKKIVDLLNMGMAHQGYVEILYLPENPDKFAFVSDL